METINKVYINDLTNINGLCRVCLTESKKMTLLEQKVEQISERNNLTIWNLLYKVTATEISHDKRYPSYICPMCMSLLKMSYKFKLQFEESQKLLSEYFGESILDEQSLASVIEVVQEDQRDETNVAPVELISKRGKYDLKDIFIVEEEAKEKPNYTAFLKNLGKEVSASFVNDRVIKTKRTDDNNKINRVSIFSLKEPSHDDVKVQSDNEISSALEPPSNDDEHIINDDLKQSTDVGDDMDESDKKINRKISRCSVCQRVFANKKYLRLHVERMHLHKTQTFMCEICGVFLKSRSSHYHHMLKHYGKRHKCSYCQKMYFSASTLQQHITAVHKNARLHLCTICGKSFNYSNALDYHMRIHTDERKYMCTYCNKTFRMQCGLNRHLRIHTGIRPYKCTFCDKAFRSKGELDCHEMIHTGFRPYYCKYCCKGFTKTYNLKMHLLGHSGRHGCEICNKTFIELELLKTHMRTSHAMDDDNTSDKES